MSNPPLRDVFIATCELGCMAGALAYRAINYTSDQCIVKEAVMTVPIVIFGGVVGKGVAEIVATKPGTYLTTIFVAGVVTMLTMLTKEYFSDKNTVEVPVPTPQEPAVGSSGEYYEEQN